MKVTLESTSQVVYLDGVPARVWQGKTEAGVPVQAFITRVAVSTEDDVEQFDREFQEHAPPHIDWPRFMALEPDA